MLKASSVADSRVEAAGSFLGLSSENSTHMNPSFLRLILRWWQPLKTSYPWSSFNLCMFLHFLTSYRRKKLWWHRVDLQNHPSLFARRSSQEHGTSCGEHKNEWDIGSKRTCLQTSERIVRENNRERRLNTDREKEKERERERTSRIERER